MGKTFLKFDHIAINPRNRIRCPKCVYEQFYMYTHNLSCNLSIYHEGKRKSRVHKYRPMTLEEKNKYKIKMPNAKAFPNVKDSKYSMLVYPVNVPISAATMCRSCKSRITLRFEFGPDGLLQRRGKPTILRSIS